jgi:PAS domain-containing protein
MAEGLSGAFVLAPEATAIFALKREAMAHKLPIEIQDFRTLITEGYKYVDKTKYLYQMATMGKAYFLSRPRRFGKSLTVATLQELYSGSQELFKGLWIEDRWDWNKRHPVVRLSLKDVNFEQLGLEKALFKRMEELSRRMGVPVNQETARDQFREIIQTLGSEQKVVVLIDEYDAPIVHYLGKDVRTAYANQELLRSFYGVLKDLEAYLELVFLTGVSKFAKVGIFSGLNNLRDITMHPQYATMLGYTQAELEVNFEEEIVQTADYLHLTREQLLEQLRLWYNGYRFEEHGERLYNPVSINNFFYFQKFQNYWFATGTPTFLIQLLKEQGVYDVGMQHVNPSGFDTFELDNLKLSAILYQTGYLTITGVDEEGLLTLDYPNKEVRDSMLQQLLEAFVGVEVEKSTSTAIELQRAFEAGDLERVFRLLRGVFGGVPYWLHEKWPERFFHASIFLLFRYMCVRAHSEVCTSEGRMDCAVETLGRVYILEFKLDEPAEVALEQIRQRRYYEAWWHLGKPVIGVGVELPSQRRNVERWVAEEISA